MKLVTGNPACQPVSLSGWAEACCAIGALGRLKAEAYYTAGALIQAQRAVIPQPKASPWVCVYP
jgi:hypothetical protein